MLASIRTRILLTCVVTVVDALIFAGGPNYLVTRSHNSESIRQDLQFVARGHTVGINDWAAPKMQVMMPLQDMAASTDPTPVFKTVHKASDSINVYIGYPDRSHKFSSPRGTPSTHDPTARPWYKQAVDAGRPMATPPYISTGTG